MTKRRKACRIPDAKSPDDDREVGCRSEMSRHLRLLADALDNRDLLTIPVDWDSIDRRIVEIKANEGR